MLKRLKNIDNKTDNQIKENKDSQLGKQSIGYKIREELSQEAKNMLEMLSNQENLINCQKLYLKGGNNVEYDFTNFSSLRAPFKAIYYGEILIPGADREQDDFDKWYELLKIYKTKKDSKYNKLKDDLLINAQDFNDGRKMIIEAFKNKIFPLSNPDYYPKYTSPRGATGESDFTADDLDKMHIGNADDLDKLLLDTEKYLDLDLIEKYFF